MDKKSWVCTLITQLSLCFALFAALKIGTPQKPIYQDRDERRPLDLYFVSVRGGSSRPPEERTHLLKQMEKVVKTYKARFVINLSELGEEDPLIQNATWHFKSFKVPWYTTKALKAQAEDYFLKQIKMPYGKTLDLIVLDTSSLQDPSSASRNDQLNWLRRTLEASNANWIIVAGIHPLVSCNQNAEQMATKEVLEPLQHIFLKYGVNAYLSGRLCAEASNEGNITDISNKGPVTKGPYFSAINQRVVSDRETVRGFLLHRVSSLEIVTYSVTLTGDVVPKTVLRQWGKEVM